MSGHSDRATDPAMSSRNTRFLFWLTGPLLAALLVSWAVIGRGGPGFFFLSLVGGALLMFVVPLVQLVLLRTARFKGRDAAACFAALGVVVAAIFLLAASGAFSFW